MDSINIKKMNNGTVHLPVEKAGYNSSFQRMSFKIGKNGINLTMNKIQMLEEILNGNIWLIDKFDINQVSYLKDEVIVKPIHVRKLINQFLCKAISAADLQKWARFICMRTEYVVPGGDNDEVNDHYEDMYYVVQLLSTPEIDGEINEAQVRTYLQKLEKYPDDIG
jgi:hypothetical protein